MAKSFNELRRKMLPEQQEQAKAKTAAMLQKLPLYELRLARKLSQEEVAAALDIQQAGIVRYRTGTFHSNL